MYIYMLDIYVYILLDIYIYIVGYIEIYEHKIVYLS
jgi:hypothetical protein